MCFHTVVDVSASAALMNKLLFESSMSCTFQGPRETVADVEVAVVVEGASKSLMMVNAAGKDPGAE